MRIIAILSILLLSCSFELNNPESYIISPEFEEYWSRGLAEVSVYQLTQARYGEIHSGKMILIFVKERVGTKSHVKLDNQENEGLEVLKCNHIRKFSTGIYDYSLMNTSMTGLQGIQKEKLVRSTTSEQDWCGHVFSELNLSGDHYDYQVSSYFEGESGEKEVSLSQSEEAILNQIRIDPGKIPEGRISLIPSAFFVRLRHIEFKPEDANISKISSDSLNTLSIKYEKINRSVDIVYKKDFPHEIISMKEEYISGWGDEKRMLSTTAKRISANWLEYWKLHDRNDAYWREKIQLED